MLFALKEDLLDHVNASLTTLEILTLPADLNVQQMLNVHLAKHVKTYIVWTHVQVLDVESMPNVKLSIILQTVSACKDTLEILSHLVDSLLLSLNQWNMKIHVTPILVDQTAIHQES